MKQLWEKDLTNPTNCQVCGNDDPYFMPARKNGIISLTFRILDHIYDATPSGFPLSFNVARVEMDGTLIEDLGGFNTDYNQKSLVAGSSTDYRYDIFIPSPCSEGLAQFPDPEIYYCGVLQGVVGDVANITLDGVQYVWTIGEPVPHPIYEIGDGIFLATCTTALDLVINDPTLTLINTLLAPVLGTETACHRYKVDFTYDGTPYTFYSVPFDCAPCGDDVINIEVRNNDGFVDCCGITYDTSDTFGGVGAPSPRLDLKTTSRLSIYGYTKWEAPTLEMEYAANCYHNKSIKTERVKAMGIPMPYWLSDAVGCIFSGKTFYVEGVEYLLDGETYLEENETPVTESHNLSVSLKKCKCEKTFVC